MLVRTIAIALSLAACTTDPILAADTADLTCGPFCDPADLNEQQALDLTLRYGTWAFPDSTIYDQSCANIGSDDRPQWDCVVSLITSANPCGTVAVECVRSSCNWKALDGCH